MTVRVPALLAAAASLSLVGSSCPKPVPPDRFPNCVCALQRRDLVMPQFERYLDPQKRDPAPKPAGWLNLPVQMADVEGDGRMDLSTYQQAGAFIFQLREPFFGTLPNLNATAHGTALVDVDDDGILDLFVAPHFEDLNEEKGQERQPVYLVGRAANDARYQRKQLCVQVGTSTVPILKLLASIPKAKDAKWNSETIAVGDVDGDGRADVYLSFYQDDQDSGHRSLLLMNKGNLVGCDHEIGPYFSEEAVDRGVAGPFRPDPEGANLVDLRRTGLLDLVSQGRVYLNRADRPGFFRAHWLSDLGLPPGIFDTQPNGDKNAKDEGLHVVDYNRDGWFDLFLRVQERSNLLWRREPPTSCSDPIWFVNAGDESGLKAILGPKGHERGHNWGDAWGDFNLDGSFDLLYQTGDFDGDAQSQRGLILLNDGQGHFRESTLPRLPHSGVVAVGDIDGDGALDLYFADSGQIWRNTTTRSGTHALAVSPRSGGRRNQYGATVLVKETCPRDDGTPLGTQIINVGGSATYLAEGQYDAHIGVEEGQCYKIDVQFPRGPDGAPTVTDIPFNPAAEHGRRLVVDRRPTVPLPTEAGTTPIPTAPKVVAREPYGP
jgi:hypothetical protein